MTGPLLKIHGLRVGYKGREILHGIDLTVQHGGFVTVVGPNGSGKSTLALAVAGLIPVSAGTIYFLDEDISRVSPGERLRRGIAILLQGHHVFGRMTVEENLLLGSYFDRGHARLALRRAYATFPFLHQRRHVLAGSLSGGEQQQLALARMLGLDVRLLVFDEPFLGLAPASIHSVRDLIRGWHDSHTAIMLIEHRRSSLSGCSTTIIPLADGKVASLPDNPTSGAGVAT